MKILHVNDYYHGRGGVEQYLLSAARLLERHGCDNIILYRRDHPNTIQDSRWPAYLLEETGQPVSHTVEAIVRAERPDVAYVHHTSSPEVVQAVSSLLPTVAYVHGFQAVCPGLAKYFRRGDTVCQRPFGWGCVPMHYLRRCSAARHPATLYRLMRRTARLKRAYLSVPRILVATDYIKSLLIQNGFDPRRISLLPPHFFPDGASAEFEPPRNPHIVLFAGRLEIEKGLSYLLRALSQIHAPTRLVVAGDGTRRPDYEELARNLHLFDQVHFAGWLSQADMEEAYQDCSLLAMPSICPESFGRTGIEALAHGRPVVAFDVGGISDWLRDGANGLLVTPTDVGQLADSIQRLLFDRSLRLRMGRSGQQDVFQRFRASAHLRALLSALQAPIMDREDSNV